MKDKSHDAEAFYGSATLGEKGQVVIPAEARARMKLKKGEKLLVFGMGCEMLAICKLSQVERFATHLARRVKAIRKIARTAAR